MPNYFILHIDMNSYFASVEQQANPLFRYKPVGVCAYLSPKGCIIASSKEAKKIGIKVGTLVEQAKQIDPQVILVENEPAKYRATTSKIFKIFSDYTERIEPYSIDEAFLDLTGYIHSYQQGEKLIKKLKTRIKNEVGEWLTCSAGLSWTRWLAKFASDITQSDSYLTIDSLNKAEEIYKKVEMQEAWGIAWRMEKRLNNLGIYSLMDLKNYPVANLMQAFGKPGYYLWANLNGIEIEGVRTQAEQPPKSIGHSYCIPKQEPDPQYLKAILMKLCEKTGRRLRQSQLEAQVIWAGYYLKYGGGYFKHKKIPERLYTNQEIFQAAWKIFTTKMPQTKVKMLGVSVCSLKPLSHQLNIFNQYKPVHLCQALDQINSKFGEFTVYPGSMWGIKKQAPDRVGFRKTVKIEPKVENIHYDKTESTISG